MSFLKWLALLLFCGQILFSEDSIPTNQWFEIPRKVVFMEGFEGGNYQNRKWSRMVYNSADGHCYFYEGYLNSKLEIPQTIYGNTLYKIDLDKKLIEMKAISNWKKKPGKDGEWYNDVDPNSPFDRHTYGCFIYVDKLNGILMSHGASGGNNARVTDTWLYSFEKNKWETFPSVGDIKGSNANFENQMMYLPGSDSVYLTSRVVKDVVLYKHTFGQKEWVKLERQKIEGMQTGVALWGSNGKVDTKRGRYVFIGGSFMKDGVRFGSNQFVVFDFKTETFSTLTPASTEVPEGFIRVPYLAYDSENDVYIVHNNNENVGTWLFNPNDNKWKKIDVGVGPESGEFSEYDPKRKLMIVQANGKIFGLKLDLNTLSKKNEVLKSDGNLSLPKENPAITEGLAHLDQAKKLYKESNTSGALAECEKGVAKITSFLNEQRDADGKLPYHLIEYDNKLDMWRGFRKHLREQNIIEQQLKNQK